MQQEDDLRALAKIMDFLRAVSIILVVMNVYWYCYASIVEWHLFFSWPCRAWVQKA